MGVFGNSSGETGVEGIVSNSLIYEFSRNGRNISHRSEGAEATLSGIVRSVTTGSVSRDNVHSVAERQVTVLISLELIDTKGSVLWQASGISESEEYEVAADRGTTEIYKREAITRLAARLAEKIYYQMTEDF